MQTDTATDARASDALARAQKGASANTDAQVIGFFAAHGIDATPRLDVFTYAAWQALGRTVCKGESGCRLRVWLNYKSASESDEEGAGRGVFKNVSVFHISQTAPISEPKDAARIPIIARSPEPETDAAPASDTPSDTPAPRLAKPQRHALSHIPRLLATCANRRQAANEAIAVPRQTNTPKRMQVAQGIINDARLQLMACDALEALLWGDIKIYQPILDKITSWPAWTKAFRAATSEWDTKPTLLRTWCDAWVKSDKQTEQAKAAQREADRLEALEKTRGAGIDLFPTAPWFADQLAASLPSGIIEILEPSAGRGALSKAAHRVAARGSSVLALELSHSCVDLLKLEHADDLGVIVEQADFMAWQAPHEFDAVIMNPPFSADAEHIQHAWAMLANGGTMIAIFCASRRQGSRPRDTQFREFLADIGADYVPCPDNCFEGTKASAYYFITTKGNAK